VTTSIDETLLESIVAGVLDRLRGSSAPPTVNRSAKARDTIEAPKQFEPFSLTDRVITEAVLDSKLNGAKVVRFSPKAVLTPTARDYLRVHQIHWSIAERSADKADKNAARNWAAMIVHSTSAVERVLADVLPDARRELLGCPDDAASFAIAELSRGGFDAAILFAQQTYRAACLANRHASVKAVAVRDAAEVNAVRRQLRANVWCLDPSGRTYFELRNTLKAIVSG
jgi:hypothetical protein